MVQEVLLHLNLLEKLGCKTTDLFCEPDGTFPGHNSEPLPENLTVLIKKVPDSKSRYWCSPRW